jgi:hypothetical protein
MRCHERGVCAGVYVVRDHRRVVELVDLVGAQNHDHIGAGFFDKALVSKQCVGVALVPPSLLVVSLVRGEDAEAAVGLVEIPGPPVCDVIVQRVRFVLLHHPNIRDPAVHAVAERKVDEPVHPGEGHGGLGAILGENLETIPLSSGQDKR